MAIRNNQLSEHKFWEGKVKLYYIRSLSLVRSKVNHLCFCTACKRCYAEAQARQQLTQVSLSLVSHGVIRDKGSRTRTVIPINLTQRS
jgi:hypothetical protein